MKVLFAVNNDNVSEAIAKKYEREYKDILSYKNVYYFNAIIRELQRDKTYNRVVISEDLEPFANNNYDMIDKFLLEKYNNISKEAKALNEERIEVILLCADRRKKSDDMLVKIFNLEIYNAILGQDRSIEEVCKLIHSPRESNEARQYYNIQVNGLAGQEDSENNVSEAEVENILAHYKRLGKNEDKYVDSFNNIISQYTDTQLKIIIKYLPIHVKAVLEEKSPKYQQLVTSGLPNQNMNFELKSNKYKQKLQKRSFRKSKEDDYDDEDLDENVIDREFSQPKLTKPVVIPSDINTENVQKISVPKITMESSENILTPEVNNIGGIQEPKPQNQSQVQNQFEIPEEPQPKTGELFGMSEEKPKMETVDLFGMSEESQPKTEELFEMPKQSQSRIENAFEMPEEPQPKPEELFGISEEKPKAETANLLEMSEQSQTGTIDLFNESEESQSKTEELFEASEESQVQADSEPVKRGRGRPRKKPLVEVDPNKPKRGRGRPRKEETLVETENITTEQGTPQVNQEMSTSNQTNSETESISSMINQTTSAIEQTSSTLNQENDLFNMSEEIQQNNTTEEVDLFNIGEEVQQQDTGIDLFNLDENTNRDNTTTNSMNTNNNEFVDKEINVPILEKKEDILRPQEPDLFNANSNMNSIGYDNDITTTNRTSTNSNWNTLLTSDKKIVAFVGTTKNGTSFIVNNTAELLASMGISTAILDMTKSKNSYYIYTNNEEELRNVSTKCMKNLENGIAEGLRINKSLTVYTQMPGEEEKYNIDRILSTLVQNYSAILIDTDFDTPIEIFERVQELYLVQSMDVLTIQPLTAFLRNLKSKNILQQEKLKIVINKSQKIRSLNVKTLIGGMSCYNAPNMSYMTELFDKDNIRYCEIPFETQNYAKYLDSLVNCSISLNGYTKTLLASLRELANIVYPLVNKQGYSPMNATKKEPFSKQMSSTLSKMKNKGY